MCLTSNVLLGVVEDYNEHPFKKWYESEVGFSLSTDDPAIFDINLSGEYSIAASIICNYIDVNLLKQNWLSAAFDPNAAKRALEKT